MSASFWLAPGRGSYGKSELGTLSSLVEDLGEEGSTLVTLLEEERADVLPSGPSLLGLDQSETFRPATMLPGQNASPLIFACTVLDSRRAQRDGEPVLVGGNSLGFYSALVLCGALQPEDGMRLVCTMAKLQEDGPAGGQVLWTLLDDDWNLLGERERRLDEIMARIRESGHEIALSIRLGGHVVIAGDETAMRALLDQLPGVRLGQRDFPFRLPFHGPFHTPLLTRVAERALDELGDLDIRVPRYPLVDGRGFVWTPRATDPKALLEYTLTTQVTTTFDLTAAMRVALLDWAPEHVDLLAPGSSLRAPLGHVERFLERGVLTR